MMRKITYLVFLFALEFCFAQETIGLILDDATRNKSEGYTLINPRSDDRVFLIDNCGEKVNQWDFSGKKSYLSYILENGNLLQTSRFDADIRDWENNVLWEINYLDTFGFQIHHDIEPLPNGNFLVLVRDVYNAVDLFDIGLDTSYSLPTLVLERIIEIEPVGVNSAQIVWEWKLFDHLVQNFDATKSNYGDVASNPQLLDINYDGGFGSDFIHANALDYNEDLDQIAISNRHLNEVFVIDHSTTTAQAASHSGGIYGKGGDILWRWGNPEVYKKGTVADRQLGRQHDIKWISEGPSQGMMSVFSNDGYGSDVFASSIHIIDQNAVNGVYNLDAGKFLPQDYTWSWDGVIMGEAMHASAQSGVQIMSNGNALINETDIGRISEVDLLGNVIWVYRIPLGNGVIFDQFNEPEGNGAFRAHRYAEDYIGFSNYDLNNYGTIENDNSISLNCGNRLSVSESQRSQLRTYPNPVTDKITFDTNGHIDSITVFDITGKVVFEKANTKSLNLKQLPAGIYMVKYFIGKASDVVKVVKL